MPIKHRNQSIATLLWKIFLECKAKIRRCLEFFEHAQKIGMTVGVACSAFSIKLAMVCGEGICKKCKKHLDKTNLICYSQNVKGRENAKSRLDIFRYDNRQNDRKA